MISKRIIPMFLLQGKRLFKGTNFRDLMDVGDPTAQAMIYDAQGADEIAVVDIEASRNSRIIDIEIIKNMINECHLPISVGGGIKTIDDALRCFEAGADKIIVNTNACLNPMLIRQFSDEFGAQSVVVSIDVRKGRNGQYDIYIYSGTQKLEKNLYEYLEEVIRNGAGELIITSMDKEGTMQGFDYGLYESLKNSLPIPLIASGGAGSYDDIVKLFRDTECDAVTIGKMLFLRDYDIVRIKSYLKGKHVLVREA